jgi:hypothetical protein
MKENTKYIVAGSLLFTIIIIYIFRNKIKTFLGFEEDYNLQYAMLYPDALENQNFPPSIEGCTNSCKIINTGIIDQAKCMDSCMHTSGYIPYIEMLTNKQQLIDSL